jgi:aspartyl-tRNA(Asn)/glutamyl-tRNA(Gln) amidotransferase subunit A
MNNLTTLTIAQASALLARGEIKAIKLIDAYLSRIERLDSKLNAFVTLMADSARASAVQADREIAGGHRRGPLHGIPIGIKISTKRRVFVPPASHI